MLPVHHKRVFWILLFSGCCWCVSCWTSHEMLLDVGKTRVHTRKMLMLFGMPVWKSCLGRYAAWLLLYLAACSLFCEVLARSLPASTPSKLCCLPSCTLSWCVWTEAANARDWKLWRSSTCDSLCLSACCIAVWWSPTKCAPRYNVLIRWHVAPGQSFCRYFSRHFASCLIQIVP